MRKLAALLLGLLVLGGCSRGPAAPPPPTPGPETVLADDQVGQLVAALPQRSPAALDARRLAPGLPPPTNRWYAGLVFGPEPQPVFPLPVSFALTGGGFALGLPKVAVSADVIAGGHSPDLAVGVGADHATVVTSDPSVVGIDLVADGGTVLGRTTIAQGSPFVSWRAAGPGSLRIPEGFVPAGDGVYAATLNNTRYALAVTGGRVDGSSVALDAGGTASFWPVPEGHEPGELVRYAQPPTASSLDYRVGAEEVSTTLNYTGGETAITRLPHHGDQAGCGLGTYPSVYGPLELCAGPLSWTTPRTDAVASLDLSGLDEARRDELTRHLDADIATLDAFPADTYFGGKALQRAAMLLTVSDALGLTDRADQVARILDQQLSTWTDPSGCSVRDERCFVYDPAGRGVVGLAASFGSDQYNDHHFHYGYFLYAAAVLARHDPSAVQRLAPVVNLLAADIASAGGRAFPDRRVFDAWSGHSWASGTAPFADGNNQESVSEAVNAWAGLLLWARAIDDPSLATEAEWLLSLEADASRHLWLEPDVAGFAGYAHRTLVLNWGGKRDHATWFSAEPAAKLGILLLPMSPSSVYLAGSPEAIRANVEEAVGTHPEQKFGDYITMYAALAGPADRDRSVAVARGLPDDVLDDGMSRTYLLAWLYALRF